MLVLLLFMLSFIFFFKQKTAYEMRISDWSSDVCSSDLAEADDRDGQDHPLRRAGRDPRSLRRHRPRGRGAAARGAVPAEAGGAGADHAARHEGDRKSVV